ncbi:MAG: FtsX-like permease family protein, partial [Bacilli bacterium]|nr:FtsX-like permease family protein [Bacilli bacterium]
SSFINFIDSDASPINFYDIITNKNSIDLENDTLSYNTYLHNNYRFANAYNNPEIIYKDLPGVGRFPVDIKRSSITSVMDAMNYIGGYSTITSVLVFPKDLSSKQQIFKYLDKWNEGKPEEAQIMYADLAGTLTDALGTMIDIISIVLIVFSSVSLLVSCVMTGVITYTSVLERTKEIGILRAVGARKKDVGRLFEAESVIIGGIAGLAGVLFTFIVEWPISIIINTRFPEQNIGMICNLSPWHALILVAISILLTFVSGFIPARKAAKKDPVVALRTE